MEDKDKKEEPIIKDAEVKEEVKAPKIRQILIETDGNNIKLVKAEVSGSIELVAILQNIIGYVGKENK